MMNKVAVITRTKDRAVYLKRALDSVAAQTYPDYIHVIINDGGDRVAVEEIISSLSDSHKQKLKIFHRDQASGAPDTIFNESIDRVNSEYVAIHDDDDTWHPEFLERTVALLETGVAGVVVRSDRIDEELVSEQILHKKTTRYLPDMVSVSLYRQCIDNQLTPIAFIYRRDVYESIGKYDDTLPVVGDWEFGIRFLMRHEVEYLDPGFALANYHRRKGSNDNSFTKYNHNHRKYVTLVANRYLRDDIAAGKLGIGYIISDLKYQQDVRHGIVKKVIPKTIINRLRR